jgi:Flp pilus assembly protein TadG
MSHTSHTPRRRRPDSGEALVEMALVLPILLVLSLGMLDFGRAFHAKNIVDSAAREACRVAVVTTPDKPLAIGRANDILTAGGITGATVVSDVLPDMTITVTVTARFTFVTPGLFLLFGTFQNAQGNDDPNGINMIGKATMRKE